MGWAASVAEANVGGRPFVVLTGIRGLRSEEPTSAEASRTPQVSRSAADERTVDERTTGVSTADEQTAQQRVQLLLRAPTAAVGAEAFAVAARALLVAHRWLQSSDGDDTHGLHCRSDRRRRARPIVAKASDVSGGWAVGGGGAWELAAHALLTLLMATGDGERGGAAPPGEGGQAPLQREEKEQEKEQAEQEKQAEEEEEEKAATREGKGCGRACRRCGFAVVPLVPSGDRGEALPGSTPWQRAWCPNLPWPAVRAAAGARAHLLPPMFIFPAEKKNRVAKRS